MQIEQVRELVKLVEESGIEELEISHKDTTIRIQKSRTSYVAAQPAAQLAVAAPPAGAAPAAAPGGEAAAADAAREGERAQWKEIRSPIVGTFYRAPAPDADPYVKVGDRITEGQVLCIIEAMKVMNEIEAEFGGTIKEILVENAQPVEAEGVLFLVDPRA